MILYLYLSLSMLSLVLTFLLHSEKKIHYLFFSISGIAQVLFIFYNIFRIRYPILDTTLIIAALSIVFICFLDLIFILFLLKKQTLVKLTTFSTKYYKFHVEWPLRILHETFCRLA